MLALTWWDWYYKNAFLFSFFGGVSVKEVKQVSNWVSDSELGGNPAWAHLRRRFYHLPSQAFWAGCHFLWTRLRLWPGLVSKAIPVQLPLGLMCLGFGQPACKWFFHLQMPLRLPNLIIMSLYNYKGKEVFTLSNEYKLSAIWKYKEIKINICPFCQRIYICATGTNK